MTTTNEIAGTVRELLPIESYGNKGFRKRLLILEQFNGSYINQIPIEFINDQCDRVEKLAPGDEVRIRFQLRGRKWQLDETTPPKYFLSAEGTEFFLVKASDQPPAEETVEKAPY